MMESVKEVEKMVEDLQERVIDLENEVERTYTNEELRKENERLKKVDKFRWTIISNIGYMCEANEQGPDDILEDPANFEDMENWDGYTFYDYRQMVTVMLAFFIKANKDKFDELYIADEIKGFRETTYGRFFLVGSLCKKRFILELYSDRMPYFLKQGIECLEIAEVDDPDDAYKNAIDAFVEFMGKEL